MDRLTKSELINGFPACYLKNNSGLPELIMKNNPYRKIVEKLKEYEDLEEQGKLLKLPVPVGSLVYEPYQFMGEGAWEIDVHKIRLGDLDKIGKTVFITREAAEAALKEMSKE